VTAQVRGTGASEAADRTQTEALAQEIFASIANRWALLIINALGEDTLRFTEVRAALEGISHKMLAQTLRSLERDGIVKRLVHPIVPPRVDYSLTEAGLVLRATVNEMCTWTRRHLDHIVEARHRFDAQPR
jgi:DNA-binding HxlR family transcriptional regulator